MSRYNTYVGVIHSTVLANLSQFSGPFPSGASREFTCQIGPATTTGNIGGVGGVGAVLSRGIEGESDGEPIVSQPSPFDPPGRTTIEQSSEPKPQ